MAKPVPPDAPVKDVVPTAKAQSVPRNAPVTAAVPAAKATTVPRNAKLKDAVPTAKATTVPRGATVLDAVPAALANPVPRGATVLDAVPAALALAVLVTAKVPVAAKTPRSQTYPAPPIRLNINATTSIRNMIIASGLELPPGVNAQLAAKATLPTAAPATMPTPLTVRALVLKMAKPAP